MASTALDPALDAPLHAYDVKIFSQYDQLLEVDALLARNSVEAGDITFELMRRLNGYRAEIAFQYGDERFCFRLQRTVFN